LFFGEAKAILNLSEKLFIFDQPTNSIQFFSILRQTFPQLSPIFDHSILAINLEYVQNDQAVNLKDGDEIALIPPLSGG